MPDIVLVILKFAFIAILYIFVARAVRAVAVGMRTSDVAAAPRPQPAPRQSAKKKGRSPRKATVVEGKSRSGGSFDVADELVIGRGEKCHIVLDDTYVSTVHARIFSKGETVMVEDLGSTNGTYLNRRRITSPMELQRGDRVKIGKTVLEMRR